MAFDPTMVKISSTLLNRILAAVGYPVLKIEDLEINRDEVIELAVVPAMEAYFSLFPISKVQEISLAGAISVPFPDPDLTLGVCQAQMTVDVGSNLVPSMNPFVNERNYNLSQGSLFGGGRNGDMDTVEARILQRAYAQSAVNLLSARSITVDYANKQLTGWCNTPGVARIIWGLMSYDVDAGVELQNRAAFIRFCQFNLLEIIATIRGGVKLSDDVQVDAAEMQSRADEGREKILTDWRSVTRGAVIRG